MQCGMSGTCRGLLSDQWNTRQGCNSHKARIVDGDGFWQSKPLGSVILAPSPHCSACYMECCRRRSQTQPALQLGVTITTRKEDLTALSTLTAGLRKTWSKNLSFIALTALEQRMLNASLPPPCCASTEGSAVRSNVLFFHIPTDGGCPSVASTCFALS